MRDETKGEDLAARDRALIVQARELADCKRPSLIDNRAFRTQTAKRRGLPLQGVETGVIFGAFFYPARGRRYPAEIDQLRCSVLVAGS